MVREHIENALKEIEHLVETAPAEAGRELALAKTKLDEAELWLTKAEQIAGAVQTEVEPPPAAAAVPEPEPTP
jgi:predicted S18 family serine protease